MKKERKNLLRSRRGITMTEVVISLVIIGIISSAALSLVMSSINVEKTSFSVVEAKNIAENALACFRYGESQEEFTEALNKTGVYETQADGSLLLTGNGYTVTVKADYAQNYFDYSAISASGAEIFSFRYPNNAQGGTP